MASLEELREERLKKLSLLTERGVPAYPAKTRRDTEVRDAIASFDEPQKKNAVLILAGRVRTLRKQGALVFFNFDDGTGIFQGLIKKDEIGDDQFSLFDETVDGGDFVEVAGALFLTKRGEKTLAVREWRMLAKALRPLPDKWHGLADVEERYRKRYLDLLMSPEVKEKFLLRSRIIAFLRAQLDGAGYIEVETPVLQPLYGGASAEPFTTHHNALDVDLYLRISDELYLKRLLIGGIPKVYEFCRDFRNEGIDATHNPEFTQLEFYESFSDAEKQMQFVEGLFCQLGENVLDGPSITHDGKEISLCGTFPRISYYETFVRFAEVAHAETASAEELLKIARDTGAEVGEGENLPGRQAGRTKILDAIFKKLVRPKLIQPTFIVDYPAEMLPLAKNKTEKIVDAFQLYAGGLELVKAFSEQNDPFAQREKFLAQEERGKKGESEIQHLDEDFLEAIEHGMPPAGGVGIGIDRLMMLLTDTKNIREVILFPTLRPKI